MMSITIVLLVLFPSMALAKFNLHGEPLLAGATSFSLDIVISTVTKPTPCYITSGVVTQCRRKRGIKERPHIVYSDISPSAVTRVEITDAPQLIPPVGVDSIISSFDDSTSFFRQLKGWNNVISVGDCGQSVVNFSQFLSCLGLTIRETKTLTAAYTLTETLSKGYVTMTVLRCTPTGFPYVYCPVSNAGDSVTDVTTEDAVVIWEITQNPETTEERPIPDSLPYFFKH